MKKYLITLLIMLISGCQNIEVPKEFIYKEINTPRFKLASWQKITDSSAEFRIYIEGDGYAYNAHGKPSKNPTPHGILMRKLSFYDPAPNVIYLARPCQYVKDGQCEVDYWTTKRFSQEVIEAEYNAIKQIVSDKPLTLIGYSGGAQIAGLIFVKYPDLNIKKIITIAGNLDHKLWCNYHKIPYLKGSLNLADYSEKFSKVEQIHYVGSDDKIIPPSISKDFVLSEKTKIIKKATHSDGWEKIFNEIYNQ